MRPLSRPLRLCAAVLLFAVAACSGDKNQAYIEKPVDELYNKALDALVDERYVDAAKTFDQVESQQTASRLSRSSSRQNLPSFCVGSPAMRVLRRRRAKARCISSTSRPRACTSTTSPSCWMRSSACYGRAQVF